MLVLFAALIGPYFINWTSYRQDFEREASRILGQKVEVLGTAEARLLPFPSVTFNNVRVENARTGATMMTVRRFSMDAELAPFLRGEILIFDMRIEGPDATVKLLPDGSLDWAMPGSGRMSGQSVVLENVEVTKGIIDVVDEQHHRTQEVRNLNARISADNLDGPWRVEGTGALNGHSGAFSISTGQLENGQLRLRTRLLPDEEPVSIETEGEVGFEGARPRYSGQFTLQVLDLAAISGRSAKPANSKGGAKPAMARATGNFKIDPARLRVDQYRLEVGPTSDPYVVTGELTVDTGDSPKFLLTASGQQIDIDQLDARAKSLGKATQKGDRAVALTPSERLGVLRRIGDLIPIPPMPGKASIRLPALVAGDTTVRDIVIDAEPNGESWKIDKFVGKFPGRTQVEATGKLTLGAQFGFAGHLLVAARQPSGLADWLTGTVDPQIRLLNGAGLSADVALSSRMQRFRNLELDIGASTITGAFERTVPDDGPPQMSIDMQGDSIDLDAVRALAGLFTGDKNGLSIAGSDLTAHLAAGKFSAFGAQANDVDTIFGYSSGTLQISRLTIGKVAGAQIALAGRFSHFSGTPEGKVNASIDAKDIAPLLTMAQVLGGSNIVVNRLAGSAAALGNTHLDISGSFGAEGIDGTVTGTAGGSKLTIDVSRASVGGAFGTVPMTVELTAQNDSVNALISQIGLQPLPIDAPGPGLLSVRIDGALRKNARLALSLSGADTDLSMNGTAALLPDDDPTGQFSVQLKSDDLTPYLIMNGISLPDSASGLPVDLRGKLSVAADSIHLSPLDGSVLGNALSGDLTLTRDARPSIEGRLSLDEVDAPWFLHLLLGPRSIVDGKGGWSQSDFAPAPDFGADLDLKITADRANLGYGQPARGFNAQVSLRGAALNFGDIEALWFGGKLSGALKLVNSNGSALVTSQLVLDGADLPLALKGSGKYPVSGRVSLSSSLEGSGRSMRALVEALNGSGSASFADLTISGIRTDGFGQILKAADGKDFKIAERPVHRLALRAIDGGRFDIGRLSVPFTVTGGTLHASNISTSDEHATISGDGNIDVGAGTLDSTFVLAYKPGEPDLAGGTPSMKLSFSGPISDPHRKVDAAELANYLSLRAYEIQRRKVELLQAGVLEKQRLYRQMGLLRYVAEQKAAAAARRKAEIEAQRRAEELARQKAAEEARQKAEQAAQGQEPTDAKGDAPDDPDAAGTAPGTVPPVTDAPKSDETGSPDGGAAPQKPVPNLNFKPLKQIPGQLN